MDNLSRKEIEFDPWNSDYTNEGCYEGVCGVPSHIARLWWGKLFSPYPDERQDAAGFWWGVYMSAGGGEADYEGALFLGDMARALWRERRFEKPAV